MSTVPTAQSVISQMLLGIGQIGQANNMLLNVSDTTSTASFADKVPLTLAPGATDIAIALATLFPSITTPYAIYIREVTGGTQNGFDIGTVSGGAKLAMRAGGTFRADVDALSTLYATNDSGVNNTYLEIGVIGS